MNPEWLTILKRCGYPTDVVTIDFETFFATEFSMKKMSTIEYVQDERFEILGVGIHEQTQPHAECYPYWWAGEEEAARIVRHLQRQYGDNLERCTLVAQNAAFECMILAYRYDVRPRYVVDVLGLARHFNARQLNDLDSLCERHGLPPKGDTKEFKGWTRRRRLQPQTATQRRRRVPPVTYPIISQRREEKISDYCCNDVAREWDLFRIYLPLLSRPDVELRIMQHTMDQLTTPKLAVNHEFGEQLARKMENRINELISVTGHTKPEISGRNSFLRLMTEACAAADEIVPTKLNASGVPILALAKDDPQREQFETHPNDTIRNLVLAKNSLTAWRNHAMRVRRIMAQCIAAGGLLPVPLKYHGAHTGRWSGGERINLQNLPSRNPDDLINSIRNMLIAPPGKELVIADASQIEARVLAWIAGQEDLCGMFANGVEIYCEYAGRMVGQRLRKARKNDPQPIAAHLTRMRNMGKVQVLGCGYGMGWEQCQIFASVTYGVELSQHDARKLVNSYRESVPAILQFWHDVEQHFAMAAKWGRESEMPRGLKFYKENETVTVIELPCSRKLRYHNVKVSGVGRHRTITVANDMELKRVYLWGGALTENIVQAMSRDILAEALLKMETLGCPIPLTVHDELVGVVDEGDGKKMLPVMVETLSRAPEWAPDCPLGAEGKVSPYYVK